MLYSCTHMATVSVKGLKMFLPICLLTGVQRRQAGSERLLCGGAVRRSTVPRGGLR